MYTNSNMILKRIRPHFALDLSARRRDINWHWEWSKITPLGRKKFMIVESPPCFTQKPLLTTCHWQVILSDARQTPLNTPYMFISLERLVTKNQLLNTKYQTPNVSLIFLLSSQFEKKREHTGLFLQKKGKQKNVCWHLVFSQGRSNEKNSNRHLRFPGHIKREAKQTRNTYQ